MTPIYLNMWEDTKFIGVMDDFDVPEEAIKNLEILLASYGCENYEGEAFVLYKKDGKLYEVNGGHCSCYGLEGQWEPVETTVAELLHRLDKGDLGTSTYSGNLFAEELRKLLRTL